MYLNAYNEISSLDLTDGNLKGNLNIVQRNTRVKIEILIWPLCKRYSLWGGGGIAYNHLHNSMYES